MARTRIRPNQGIESSESYDDAKSLSTRTDAETAPVTLDDDLNYLRTLIKEAKGSTNWYDAPANDLDTLDGYVSATRGELDTLEVSLGDMIATDGSWDGFGNDTNLLGSSADGYNAFLALDDGYTSLQSEISSVDGYAKSTRSELDTLEGSLGEMVGGDGSFNGFGGDTNLLGAVVDGYNAFLALDDGYTSLQSEVSVVSSSSSDNSTDISEIRTAIGITDGETSLTTPFSDSTVETILGNGDTFGSQTGVSTPSSVVDAFNQMGTKIDSVAAGLDPKESVRAASTADVGGTYNGAASPDEITGLGASLSIDGVALTNGDRVLLKDQTDAKQNGIYTYDGTDVLSRAADQDGAPSSEVSGGNFTFVETGSTNQGTGWVIQGDGQLTLDTDNINWVQFSDTTLNLSTLAGDQLDENGTSLFVTSTLQDVYKNDTDGNGAVITTDATDGYIEITGTEAFNVTTSGGFDVDTTGAISFDADSASNFSVDGANLTLETANSGDIDMNSAAAATLDAVSGISLDAGAASNLSTSSGNLTLEAGSSDGYLAFDQQFTTNPIYLSTGATSFNSTIEAVDGRTGNDIGIIDAINAAASSGGGTAEKAIFVIGAGDARLSSVGAGLSSNILDMDAGTGADRGSLELSTTGSSYKAERDVEVYINGVLQLPDDSQGDGTAAATDDYYVSSADNTQLVFSYDLQEGDIVTVINRQAAASEDVATGWDY